MLKDYLHEKSEKILGELKELLSFQSIGADLEYKKQTVEAAEWLAEHLKEIGLRNAEALKTEGQPIVYGEWMDAGEDKPTVMIYGHYDVQSPDPLEEWETPPFLPSVRDGYIYARGATDNKGQFFTHLKAIEHYLKEHGRLPVNVRVALEGEEESSGDSLRCWLIQNQRDLHSDLALVADTHVPHEHQPAIDYGLRGIAYFEVIAHGPKRDLHSGLYGGAVANPANALAHLLARIHDPHTGRVLIPGFYDDVVGLHPEEREILARKNIDESLFREEAGVREHWGDPEYTLLERLVARPTADVHGIVTGYIGEGPKTIIPSIAKAKVSFRLVANQKPEKIVQLFREFVNSFCVLGIQFEVRELGSAPSVLLPRDHAHMRSAHEVLHDVWGAEPVFQRSGGSIPIVSTFWNEVGILPLVIGYGLPDDRLHSPNERLKLSMFWKGIETTHALLKKLGEL